MEMRPTVLRVDDGELDHIQSVLEKLGAEVDRLAPDGDGASIRTDYDLVLTNAGRAPCVPFEVLAQGVDGRPVWIAVHDDSGASVREQMRGLGVHYLVHPELHPEVLRLLFLHALYEGPEKRAMPRTPVGSEITIRARHGSWTATLLDLALDGCCLLSPRAVDVGCSVSVVWPTTSGGDEPDRILRGRAIRSERDDSGEGDSGYRIAVSFGGIDSLARAHLESIFTGTSEDAAITTLAARTRDLRDTGPGRRSASPEILLEDVERRGGSRVPFGRRVTALIGEASHVMIGRDLSIDGMRVEATHGLHVGSEIRLAIYAAKGQQPVFVYAQVARDDGDGGVGLRFKELDPLMRRRLEQIVRGAPSIQVLSREDDDTERIVVSKAFEHEAEG
jgi:hypothetical protein